MSHRHRNTLDESTDEQQRMFRDLRERVERRQRRFQEMIERRSDQRRRSRVGPAARRGRR